MAPREGAIFRGKYVPRHARRHSTMSCEKNSEPIEFGLWTLVGPRNHVLHGAGHISAAWRIRLNRPCSAAVQKAAESIEMPVGMYTGGPKMVEWTLAPPGKYHSTIHVLRQCSLFCQMLWLLVTITVIILILFWSCILLWYVDGVVNTTENSRIVSVILMG